MRLLRLVCLGVLAGTIAGCAGVSHPGFRTDVEGEATPWTDLEFNNDPTNFQFAIVSDRCGYFRPGVFGDAVTKINYMQPEFVMSVGDLIEGYTSDTVRIDAMWEEFEGIAAAFQMPFIHVPGNHDLSNDTMEIEWKERFGPPYYHFVYGDVLFLVVDTEDPPLAQVELKPDISDTQVAYFTKVLEDNPDVRWTLVFMHEPCWAGIGESKGHPAWNTIEDILKERQYTVFAGHWHHYTTYTRHNRNYYVLSTTGGSSELRGPAYGEFDHFVWVTMTDDGPIFGNILLDGVLGPEGGKGDKTITRSEVEAKLQMRYAPVFTGSDSFKSGSTTLMLSNTSPVPAEASVHFAQHPSVRVKPAAIKLRLEPGARMDVPVSLECQNAMAVAELEPATAFVSYAFNLPGKDEAEVVTRSKTLVVEQVLDVNQCTKPVAVDGRLDDWAALGHVCADPAQLEMNPKAWKGPEDSAFRFDVSYDADFVYVAVEVTDDESYLVEKEFPWNQDAVEIRLDARPEPERSMGVGDKEFEDLLIVSIIPGQSVGQIYGHDKLPEGVQAISVKTATGHVTEVAVPAAYLDGKQGGPWQAFRLNVAVDDYDAPDPDTGAPAGQNGVQLWWRPDWRTPGNHPGSGTFIRR
jgi:Carbohydrate family 9 binding domain-like/Calcineurin-like phosphoesterase